MENCWCFRIDTNERQFLLEELEQERLRQGWGWDNGQDLRNMTMDEGAGRNRAMLKVKRGDILLVPRIPEWDHVAVCEATEDWAEAYKFEFPPGRKEYGHIFPARMIKSFVRDNRHVSGNIRSTLKNPSRFWNINHYSDDVKAILDADELDDSMTRENRFRNSIGHTFANLFDENQFKEDVYQEVSKQFSNEDWEWALVEGLRCLFPNYQVERTGGTSEKQHGTDILIRMPSLIVDFEYAIAIQVKDYEGLVADDVIEQIDKATEYWENGNNLKVIDKIVIITKALKDDNKKLLENESDVKFVFAGDLK